MNIFRFFGDLSHLVAVIILLLKIWKTRSCSGISGKSQILFAVVFTCRYLDLFTDYVSLYNTVMKIIFIVSSYTTVYFIYHKFKTTYGRSQDTFRIEYILGAVAFLALLIHERRENAYLVLELLWTFSIYLEAVAILPQLFMITRTGEAETITSHYLFFLGLYRGLYILNWIYRYYTEGFHEWIAIVAGIIQTILYCDFFYLYITKGKYCWVQFGFARLLIRKVVVCNLLYGVVLF